MVIIFAAFLAGALYLIQKAAYKKWWSSKVSVRISFEKEMVTAGEETRLFEIVENRKWLPLASLKVKFHCSRCLEFQDGMNSSVTDKYYRNDLFSVMSYQRITRTHQIKCPQRGYYGIDGIDLVGGDLFFSEEMLKSLSCEAMLYVIPAAVRTKALEFALLNINGEIAAKRYELEDPFTYKGIREYEVYDEMKAVNWKATAKTDELKVNMREHTAVSDVRIFMNLTDDNILRRKELLELSISICAGLAEALLEQGIRLSVYANAGDCISGRILCMEGNTNKGNMDEIYKALARLSLDEKLEDFEKCFGERLLGQEESLYTIFISSNRHKEFQELLCEYKKRGSFKWLCPVKEDARDILDTLKNDSFMIREEQG